MNNRNLFALFGTLLVAFLLLVAALALYGSNRNTAVLIDPTPAASTACVKPPPVCDANCVRLITARRLA